MTPPALLAVDGLNTFYGRAHILRDLSFTVDAGDVLALLGRNGAGKSTTLKAVMSLVPTASGGIAFEGASISGRPTPDVVRAGIGFVPEDRRIFTDLTVMENLEVGRRPPRSGVPHWTPERLFAIFPNLAALRDRPGGRMSGGEQQMLAVARTLMGNPRLLLLDEPSEGLAPKIVEGLADAIRRLRDEGLTILLSEPNLHFAGAVATKAVVIETGVLRFSGPMAGLMGDRDLQARYLSV